MSGKGRSKYGGITHLRAGSDYHLMSNAEKQRQAMGRAREPAMSCPDCGAQVMPVDLQSHMESRCPGYQPGPEAKWITGREAKRMGIAQTTLSFWARTQQVRYLGERMDRKYLLRDVALKVALRRGFRRR